ncbi:MAG: hypothetical protein GY909_14335 [Oligoflexia bacterium]|nr:hypothetical protein [Oligoflexia bacterium]
MSNKYKFKLDGLLKLRKFKEQQLKVQLGELVKEISFVEGEIAKAHAHIDETYTAQEDVISDEADGRMIRFFPYYLQGKREDIKAKESYLFALKKKYEIKLGEVREAMGEAKVIEKMKENDFKDYKSKRDKKMQENIEELIQIRREVRK